LYRVSKGLFGRVDASRRDLFAPVVLRCLAETNDNPVEQRRRNLVLSLDAADFFRPERERKLFLPVRHAQTVSLGTNIERNSSRRIRAVGHSRGEQVSACGLTAENDVPYSEHVVFKPGLPARPNRSTLRWLRLRVP